MPLDTEVDLGPRHIVLDGAQLPPPPQKGAQQLPSLRPMSIGAKQSPISATTELLLYNRKINMTFEDKIKTTYKEVTENSNTSSKNLKSELKKNKSRRCRHVIEKSQSQSKKFDVINVRL